MLNNFKGSANFNFNQETSEFGDYFRINVKEILKNSNKQKSKELVLKMLKNNEIFDNFLNQNFKDNLKKELKEEIKTKKQKIEKYKGKYMSKINFENIIEKLNKLYTEQFYYEIDINKEVDNFGPCYSVETNGDGPRDLLINNDANDFFNSVFGVKFKPLFYLDTGVDYNCDVELLLSYKNDKDKNIVIFISGTSGEYNDENYDANVCFKIYENLSDKQLLEIKEDCIYRNLKDVSNDFDSKLKLLRDFASNDKMILDVLKENKNLSEIIDLNFNNNLKEELNEEIKTKKTRIRKI